MESLMRQRTGQLLLIHEGIPRQLDLPVRHRRTIELLARAAAAAELVDTEGHSLQVDAVLLRQRQNICSHEGAAAGAATPTTSDCSRSTSNLAARTMSSRCAQKSFRGTSPGS